MNGLMRQGPCISSFVANGEPGQSRSCSPCCSDRDKKCIVIVIGCAVVPTDDVRAASGGRSDERVPALSLALALCHHAIVIVIAVVIVIVGSRTQGCLPVLAPRGAIVIVTGLRRTERH